MTARPLRIGVIGFGWMGQAHSRSALRHASIFGADEVAPVLVACADSDAGRRGFASRSFGFARTSDDWREVASAPDLDVIYVTAPNALHVPIIEQACAAGHDVFCEKPVGGTPEQTARAAALIGGARVRSAVGFNYRWVPLVLEAKRLIEEGRIGRIIHYRGRFFSCYGANPLAARTWRFVRDDAGFGVSSDLLSHVVDLAEHLVGEIDEVTAMTRITTAQRPLLVSADGPAGSQASSAYVTGDARSQRGEVTNEDYAGMLGRFRGGATGTFEASRTLVGPESQMAFDIYGTEGAMSWNLERMNELSLYRVADGRHAGYRAVYAGDRFPFHGSFVPGDANGIAYEDTIMIEDHQFFCRLTDGGEFRPDIRDAVRFSTVQTALLRAAASRRWEGVPAQAPARSL